MKFTYTIKEKDYLDFQLYTASQSPRFYKKQRNGRYFLTFTSLVTACYFAYIQDWGMLSYFGLTTVIFFLFYPRYFKWRQKVHYTKYIRRNYASLFGRSEELEVQGKTINLKNTTGEGQIKASELDHFIETKAHFFIQLKTGASLIVPLGGLEKQEQLRKDFLGMKVPVTKDLEWVW